MLPERTLDTEQFEDMALEMRNMISSLYPEWTDYNYHDPGITIMELFAWLREIQLYHMDQVGGPQLTYFLALLGIRRRGRKAAGTLLEIQTDKRLWLRDGSRFYAGRFCFETEGAREITGRKISCCGSEERGRFVFAGRRQLTHGGHMMFYPFGREKDCKGCFYLGLSEGLKPGTRQELSVLIYDGYPVKRNPASGAFSPLVTVSHEYYGLVGWEPLDVLSDDTYGFLQSGFLRFRCQGEMKECAIEGRSGYWIRMRITDGSPETPPVITGISFGHVPVVQKETSALAADRPAEAENGWYRVKVGHRLAESGCAEVYLRYGERFEPVTDFERRTGSGETEFGVKAADAERQGDEQFNGKSPDAIRILLWEPEFESGRMLPPGDGFPFQSVSLGNPHILPEAFELMAEDPESGGCLNLWTRVEDFHCSGPEDRHYVLDEKNGALYFGDGFHGLMPEGRRIISGYGVTWGEEGNIKQASMVPGDETEAGMSVRSLLDAGGGFGTETYEAAFQRAVLDRRKTYRAVCLKDFETLALETPGLMLMNSRAAALGDQEIYVAVMPWSEDGAGLLSPRAVRNITAYLDRRRMVGTRVRVGSPEYIEITVTVELKLYPQYREGRREAEEAVLDFFRRQTGQMGEPVRYRSLYSLLDRLECVKEIRSLLLAARGNRFSRNETGDVILPPDGAAVLKELVCSVLDE